ncbi:MAG: hypothetical protein INF84_02610 [Roseomonas sp.]|nr:hypothetical protein [Roseomonas sp.]
MARRTAPVQARGGRGERIIFPAPRLVEAFGERNQKKIKSFFLIFFAI